MQTTGRKFLLKITTIIVIVAVTTTIILVSMKLAGLSPLFFTTSTTHATSSSVQNFYVIYYGHLVNHNGEIADQTSRIITAKPKLVIIPFSFPDGQPNLTQSVLKQFHDAEIKVLTYTWTKYGSRNLDEVKADIARQLSAGADGILVDEVTNIETDSEYGYYSAIYKYIKSFGSDKVVVMNPGHYKVTERIMQISDIVSLEEEWTNHDQIPWKDKYASTRFMGVSSNEYCNQCITAANAVNKTLDAWNSGIGYHYATDKYIDLPSWFNNYASQVKEKEAIRP